ncbi:MAG: LPS export ABC transporter periplasmic protein LptC [Armatimonadetes bacterium]|nr:LPS export ABC transporter periplasmic protein LptC [Armatimonadota bacterium]
MRYVAITAVILLVLGAAAVVYWASARPRHIATGAPEQPNKTEPAPQAGKQGKPQPSLEARGVEVERRDENGRLIWKLTAGGKLQADKARGEIFTQNVNWRLETKDKVWTAQADEARLDEAARRLVLSGSVRVATEDRRMALEAENVTYQMDTKKIVLDGPVKMGVDGALATASRVVLDLNRRTMRATQVKLRYKF